MRIFTAEAKGVIARLHETLPPGVTPAERKRALREAYPFADRKGWAYKAWLRAQRDYLRKHPDPAALEQSPLWRAAKKPRKPRIARLKYVGQRRDTFGAFHLFRCPRCTAEANIDEAGLGRALHRGPECENCNARAA